ncbi:hypothetical protein MKX01_037583, partial [Papaver californicum]
FCNQRIFAVAVDMSSKLGCSNDLILTFRQYVVSQSELIFVIYIMKRITTEFTYNHAGDLKSFLQLRHDYNQGNNCLHLREKTKGMEFLDRCGVKNKSKIILVEDPSSKEKRFIEICKNAKLQSAHRVKQDISMEVEKLVVEVLK